jgi:hypothetical protein
MLSLALFGLLLSLVSIFRALARLSESPHMIEGKEKRLQLTRIFGHCPDDLITDLVNLVVTSLHLGASGEGADKLSEEDTSIVTEHTWVPALKGTEAGFLAHQSDEFTFCFVAECLYCGDGSQRPSLADWIRFIGGCLFHSRIYIFHSY